MKSHIPPQEYEEGIKSDVPRREQESTESILEKSHSAEPETVDSNKSEAESTSSEPSDLLKSSTSLITDCEKPGANQTIDQESEVQNSETASPCENDPSIPSVGSVSPLKPEKGAAEVLGDAFNDDVFGDSVSVASADPSTRQINAEESSPKPDQLLNASGVEGKGLFSGTLLDPNCECPQDSFDLFGPLASQETFTNTPGDIFSSPTGSALLIEAADTWDLLDSQPATNEATLNMTNPLIVSDQNQNETQVSDPFGTSSQTQNQGTDFDFFNPTAELFAQSVNLSDQKGATTNQTAVFSDDIFGDGKDTFPLIPAVLPTAAPSAHMDLFGDDIFASGAQLPPVSESSGVNLFVDSFFVSDNKSTEQAAVNTVTSNSWMDDLLG